MVSQHEIVSKQLRYQTRKAKAGHQFIRNHKEPIPPTHKNPRYTGKCIVPFGCPYCKGEA